jgi:hypothetical protein
MAMRMRAQSRPWRRAKADVADALDFPAHPHPASRTRHQPGNTAHGEGQQRRDAKRAKADAQTTPSTAVHQVAQQQTRGRPEQRGRGQRAGLNPCGGRIGMLV